MIKSIASVGGLTLVSRGFGFVRDIMMAAILGAGPLADAFLVALRLPNHFRAIFAEGAFNAAFVPSYARVLTQNGAHSASLFADRIFTILFVSQMILVGAAVIFTPAVISVLAPGFKDDPLRFSLAVELTRITFPYLFLITLVTFFSGMLNTLQRFAVAAAAPILLNVSIIMALALAAFFPTAGHAAAWGVFLGGVLQFLLLTADITRTGLRVRFTAQWRDHDVKRFFTVLLPAIIGSAGVQIALIADTIIATFLPAGSLAALYYADRINQLPVGAIGIAAGTVLLPEMARRVAAGDETGARAAQNRAVEITLFLAMPCVVAFLTIPDIIMRALFVRGAFTIADAAAAGATLAAYGIGLLPFVLMRTMVATFHARGDTTTPVIASLIAVAVNVALKVVLMRPYAQVGLALATAVGAWLNLGLLTLFAARGNLLGFDRRLAISVLKIGIAAVALALILILGTPLVTSLVADLSAGREEARLILLMLFGGATYATLLLAMFGRQLWRRFNGKQPR